MWLWYQYPAATTAMPRRSAETGDEGSNKRRKLNPPTDIVTLIEETMRDFNEELPQNLQELEFKKIIYRIPGNLLESGISGAQVSTNLDIFKKVCKFRDEEVSSELNKVAGSIGKSRFFPDL